MSSFRGEIPLNLPLTRGTFFDHPKIVYIYPPFAPPESTFDRAGRILIKEIYTRIGLRKMIHHVLAIGVRHPRNFCRWFDRVGKRELRVRCLPAPLRSGFVECSPKLARRLAATIKENKNRQCAQSWESSHLGIRHNSAPPPRNFAIAVQTLFLPTRKSSFLKNYIRKMRRV